MSKINDLIDDVPDTNGTFQVDVIGRITKKRYLGDFYCRIPTLKDQALIGKHEAFLNGEFPVYLNSGVLKLHKWIAYLRYTLTDYPKFWKDSDLGYDLRDDNIIEEVYNKVIEIENKWLNAIWGPGETDGSTEEKEG